MSRRRIQLRNFVYQGEVVPYVCCLTDEEAREALGSRTDANLNWQLDLLQQAQILLVDTDRKKLWVRLLDGTRERRLVFRCRDHIRLGQIAHGLRWDARQRGERPPSSGQGGRLWRSS